MEIKPATSWRISAASRLSIAPFASASASDAHGSVGMSAADRWRTSVASTALTTPSQFASPVRGRSVGFGVGVGVGGLRPKPTTSTGPSRPEKVPSPRRPSAFQPQHWRAPLAPMAHVWELPAAISTMSVARPSTATGSDELAPEPLPSWLTEFSPQQETSPEAESAQA